MGLRDLTPKSMESALGEAERLGHEYDSKAIAGAACGYATRRVINCVISTGRECPEAAMSIIRRPMQGRALVFWARS